MQSGEGFISYTIDFNISNPHNTDKSDDIVFSINDLFNIDELNKIDFKSKLISHADEPDTKIHSELINISVRNG